MPADHSDVDLTAEDGSRFGGYLAVPSSPNGVALVVLQEIFGVNANIRAIVDEYAAAGYVAVAPDLYWRQQPGVQLDPASEADRERAVALMKGLDPEQSVADARAALGAARDRVPEALRTAAVGYCFGGQIAYLLAGRGAVDVAVSYYGVGIQGKLDEAGNIRGRLLLHLAGDDHLCPPDAQQCIVDAMAPLGDRAAVFTYPGVGHAFARRGGGGFDRDAAALADQRTIEALRSPVE